MSGLRFGLNLSMSRRGAGWPPSWVVPGPDGILPAHQSEWAAARGWYDGTAYATVSAYLAAASGTFSRGSDGTRFDAFGIMQTDGSNVLRLDHGPATGEALGLRVEGARTNEYRFGSNFPTGDNTGVTSENGVAIAPNGAMEAIRIIPTSGNTASHFKNDTRALPEGTTAHSVFFKPEFYPRLALRVGNANIYAAFDGDYVSDPRVSGLARSILPNGWGRYSALRESITESTVRGVGCHPAGSGALSAFTGDDSSGSLFWGWQMEVGGFPSSYIPTNGSAALRYADSLSYTIAGTPEGTIAVSARTPLGADGSQTLWCWDDGTTANRYRLVRDSSRHLRFVVTVSGTDVVNLDLGIVADGTGLKVAASWKSGLFAASLNGAAAVTDSSYAGSLPSVTTMREGSSSNGSEWFGTIKRMRRYSTAYSAAQLPWMSS